MSQVGSNLRLSQLDPLRPSHTDQSQGSKLSFTESPYVEIARKSVPNLTLVYLSLHRFN